MRKLEEALRKLEIVVRNTSKILCLDEDGTPIDGEQELRNAQQEITIADERCPHCGGKTTRIWVATDDPKLGDPA